jgi:hypothetical protein
MNRREFITLLGGVAVGQSAENLWLCINAKASLHST